MIGSIFFMGFCLAFYWKTKQYQKQKITYCSRKQHPLLFLYPTCLFLADHILRGYKAKYMQENRAKICAVSQGENMETVVSCFFCKKIALSISVIFCSCFFIFCNQINAKYQHAVIQKNKIERPAYGAGEKQVSVEAKISGQVGKKELHFSIEEQHYTEAQRKNEFKRAKQYIDQALLGKNVSVNKICYPIHLVEKIPGSALQIRWDLGETGCIDTKGKLHNKKLGFRKQVVKIIAYIKYFDITEEYPIFLQIYPAKISKQQRIIARLKQSIQNHVKQKKEEKYVTLPTQIEQKKVYYREKQEHRGAHLFFIGMLLSVVAYFIADYDWKQRYQNRKIQLMIDYSDLVNKFVLLLGAGMSIKGAWEKIVKEYIEEKKKNNQIHYVYEEMQITYQALCNGQNEYQAYEEFGKRTRLLPYLRFASLLSQNLRKGSAEVLQLLEIEAIEAFHERKEIAKRQGEEASTKLLLPMGVILAIVLMLILVPAFSNFKY